MYTCNICHKEFSTNKRYMYHLEKCEKRTQSDYVHSISSRGKFDYGLRPSQTPRKLVDVYSSSSQRYKKSDRIIERLRREREELRSKLVDVENTYKYYDDQITRLTADNEELSNRLEETESVDRGNSIRKKYAKKLAKLKMENTSKKDFEHQADLETLKRECLQKDSVVKSLQKVIDQNNEKMENMRKQHEEMLSNYQKDADNRVENSEKKTQLLESHIEEYKQIIEDNATEHMQKMDELKNKHDIVKEENLRGGDIHRQLEDQIKQLNADLLKTKDENAKIIAENKQISDVYRIAEKREQETSDLFKKLSDDFITLKKEKTFAEKESHNIGEQMAKRNSELCDDIKRLNRIVKSDVDKKKLMEDNSKKQCIEHLLEKKKLSKDINKLEIQIQDLETELQSTKNKEVVNQQNTVKKYSAKIDKMELKEKRLENTLESLQKILDTRSKQHQEDLQNTTNRYNNMLKLQEKELQILRDKLREKTQEFDELSKLDSKYLQDSEKVKSCLMQTTHDLEEKNRNQIEAFEKDRIKMSTECKKLVKDMSELNKEYEKYRTNSESKSRVIQNKYTKDTSVLEARVKQLTELLEKEKAASKELTTSSKIQNGDVSLLQQTNEKLADEVKKIRVYMEELKKTNEHLTTRATRAEKQLESDRQTSTEKLQKVVDDNISLRQDMRAVNLKNQKDMSNLNVANKKLADGIREFEKTNEKHLNDIKLLNEQLNTHTSNTNKKNTEFNTLKEKIRSLEMVEKALKDKIESDKKVYKQQEKTLLDIQAINDKVAKQYQHLLVSNDKKSKKLIDMENNNKLLVQSMKDYEKNRDELLERVKKVTDENFKMAEEVGKCKKETERLANANETISRIIKDKRHTENDQQEEIKKLYAQNEILKKALRYNESILVKCKGDVNDDRRGNESQQTIRGVFQSPTREPRIKDTVPNR